MARTTRTHYRLREACFLLLLALTDEGRNTTAGAARSLETVTPAKAGVSGEPLLLFNRIQPITHHATDKNLQSDGLHWETQLESGLLGANFLHLDVRGISPKDPVASAADTAPGVFTIATSTGSGATTLLGNFATVDGQTAAPATNLPGANAATASSTPAAATATPLVPITATTLASTATSAPRGSLPSALPAPLATTAPVGEPSTGASVGAVQPAATAPVGAPSTGASVGAVQPAATTPVGAPSTGASVGAVQPAATAPAGTEAPLIGPSAAAAPPPAATAATQSVTPASLANPAAPSQVQPATQPQSATTITTVPPAAQSTTTQLASPPEGQLTEAAATTADTATPVTAAPATPAGTATPAAAVAATPATVAAATPATVAAATPATSVAAAAATPVAAETPAAAQTPAAAATPATAAAATPATAGVAVLAPVQQAALAAKPEGAPEKGGSIRYAWVPVMPTETNPTAAAPVVTGKSIEADPNIQPATAATATSRKNITISSAGAHQDDNVCMDDCSCWPVWALSIVVFFFYVSITFLAFYFTASLYSQGLLASNFYRGGGTWLLVAGGVGLLVGGLVGALVPPSCWAGALYLGGALMSFLVSTVLVGRRGAWLGALGGLGTGAVIGAFTYSSMGVIGVVASTVFGLLLGIVLGFAPIFRGLKINERYIYAGLRPRPAFTSSSATEGRTRSYETNPSMPPGPQTPGRHRAVPKISNSSQRFHKSNRISDPEDAAERENIADGLSGIHSATP